MLSLSCKCSLCFHCYMAYTWYVILKSCVRKVSLGGCNLHCSSAVASAKSCALSWNDSTVSLWCLLMNRPRCACSCKAGYKGSVGLVGPSATGSDWDHGCLNGFTPELLNKHTGLSDWPGRLSNHSLQTRSVLQLLARPQRAHSLAPRRDYSIWISAPIMPLLPMFPLLGFVITHKDITKHEPETKSAALLWTFSTFLWRLRVCLHLWSTYINRNNGKRIKESV